MIDAVALRRFVYDEILESGGPPASGRVAEHFRTDAPDALASLAALKIGKTVLVHPATGEIWMAGPFASVPTPYQVIGRRARWFANCIWDLLGVAVIVNEPVEVRASCADCGLPFSARVDPAAGFSSDWVAHFLLPARQWYDDVGFT